jgi:hypothetical protein
MHNGSLAGIENYAYTRTATNLVDEIQQRIVVDGVPFRNRPVTGINRPTIELGRSTYAICTPGDDQYSRTKGLSSDPSLSQLYSSPFNIAQYCCPRQFFSIHRAALVTL